MKRIAVLTSGGDAPGMNAAIRSVVRAGIAGGCEVVGIHRGYAGLIVGDARTLGTRDVSEIMQRGGTFLGSSRSEDFRSADGQREALRQLQLLEVEGLVVIGGNGSQTGAHALASLGLPVVGVASTIDNDVFGFDVTIGVDTALNIALEAIDRLKTTAAALERAFLVEVMGRDHRYLALMAGLAGGAEAIVIPELEIEPEALADEVRAARQKGKPHAIVVVAEGARHDGQWLEQYFKENPISPGFEMRLTKLGHVQRGGTPTSADRLLGLRSGFEATRCLLAEEPGLVFGQKSGEVIGVSLAAVAVNKKELDLSLLETASILAT